MGGFEARKSTPEPSSVVANPISLSLVNTREQFSRRHLHRPTPYTMDLLADGDLKQGIASQELLSL
jgi:hypothetical protein